MTPPRCQPFFFGPSESPLFGLYHPPAQRRHDCGVVVCAAWGREEICSYRSVRHLAESLAAQGLPVLRFDYAGCGNSQGDDEQPGRLDAWRGSVDAACEALKRTSGVSHVILVGLRLGAALASLSAVAREDVAALAAVFPVVSGRAYVRELRMQQMATKHAAEGGDVSILENEGAVMPEETKAEVSAIDLTRLARAPARQMLVVDRDDLPSNANWPDRLREQGCELVQTAQPGYVGMMAPPHKTEVPLQMIETVTAWVRERAAAYPAAASPAAGLQAADLATRVTLPAAAQGGQPVVETVLRFGPDNGLLGILSEPASPAAADGGRLILMINEASNRLVGPNRIHVPLARRWASLGYRVLRFDPSGMGDSPARGGYAENLVYCPTTDEDVATAIDWLRARVPQAPAPQMHLIGLCSGAYHAYRAAVQGQPIASTVLINPIVFFVDEATSLDYPDQLPESFMAEEVVRYKQSVRSVRKWVELLSKAAGWRRLLQVVRQWISWHVRKISREIARKLGLPLQKDLHGELLSVAKRRVRQNFIFASSEPGQVYLFEHAASAVEQLERQGDISIEYIPQANHSFSIYASRLKLIELVCELVEKPNRAA